MHAAPNPGSGFGSGGASGFAIHEQNVGGNARVHNGHVFYNSPPKSNRADILRWLPSVPMEKTHEQIQLQALIPFQDRLRDDGRYPGKWLLESDTFDAWLSRKVRKLWYIGMPGAGKSVIASVIIEKLLRLQKELKQTPDSPRVAYLYLSYKESYDVEKLLGTVIKQFILQDRDLPKPLSDIWKHHGEGTDPPTIRELSELLGTLIEGRKGFVVVDALDEASPEYRAHLMKLLQPQSDNLSVLVTSRLLDEFTDMSESFERINIEANSRDLDLFIDYEFSTRSRLKSFLRQDPHLQHEVKSAVKKACDGMFLLAKLQMVSLTAALKLRDIRDQLQTLPKDIDEVYSSTMARIKRMELNKRNLSLKTLSWVVFSRRPLSVEELQHALSVTSGSTELDAEQIYQEDDIRDLSGGLVTVARGVVSLVHYTAQKYFSQPEIRDEHFPEIQFTIAQTCITYLSFARVRNLDRDGNAYPAHVAREKFPTYQPPGSPDYRCSCAVCMQYVFTHYAVKYLGHHLRKIEEDADTRAIVKSLASLLRDARKRDFMLEVMIDNGFLSKYSRSATSPFTSEEYGTPKPQGEVEMPPPEQRLARQASDMTRINELHLAAYIGWPPVVERLVNTSQLLEIDALDSWGRTPLIVAVNERNWKVAQSLLDAGASVDLSVAENHPIMLRAAESGQADIVSSLISGALGPFQSWYQRSLLQVLVAIWEYFISILFFLSGGHLVSQRSSRRTRAATNHVQPIFEDESEQEKYVHHLKLLQASTGGQVATMKQVFEETKVDLKAEKSVFHITALFLAVELNRLDTLRFLLESGADINTKGLIGCTPLHRAAIRNFLSMVRLLLEKKADIDPMNLEGQTPWFSCVDPAHSEVSEMLLRAGADPNTRRPNGDSPLYRDAAAGSIESVRLLLRCGVNPSITTIYGWAPLHWAAHNGYMDCVVALVEAGADLDTMSDQSRTPLDMARQGRQEAIAEMLVRRGAKTARQVIEERAGKPVDAIK